MKIRAIALLAAASALCGQAATAHPKVENKAPANLVDIHSPIDSLTFRTHVSYRIKTPKGNTLIVPANAADIASMVTTAMTVLDKTKQAAAK